MAKKQKDTGALIIKRYGNRRLYNTETRSYVNYEELTKLIRDGNDVQVIDSATKEDVTKPVLIQLILEEEKNKQNILPVPFLLQILRAREEGTQDFFRNYLSASFDAYMKTKEEFDRRFRGLLETAAAAPQMWEKIIPGAEVMREFLTGGKKKESDET
jgi:polyhydroxyalkanoate synthesis repressor PhaR